MTAMDEKRRLRFEASLDEFRSLRSEMLRCSQNVSTAINVWLPALAVIIGGLISINRQISGQGDYTKEIILIGAIILSIQSVAFGVAYASEMRRFILVGVYIHNYIEPSIAELCDVKDDEIWPMQWERWRKNSRDTLSYPFLAAITQIPAMTVFSSITLYEFTWLPSRFQDYISSIPYISSSLSSSFSLPILPILLLAGVFVGWATMWYLFYSAFAKSNSIR